MARPISADGARAGALIIERSYREGDHLQFLRELKQNGIEAGATKIQFGAHWQSADPDWKPDELPDDYGYTLYPERYRLVYYDNGCGMGERMVDYMAGLLDLDSKDQRSGGLHDNFAMGVRVSTLPWNKAGVIVASWTPQHPDGLLMWLRYVAGADEALGYYEAATLRWVEEDGTTVRNEVAPADLFPEFIEDRPEWLGYPLSDDGAIGTGTMFLFLGNTGQEHTFLGPEGNWSTHTGPNYLSHRYFEHTPNLEVRYEDPRAADIGTWKSRRRVRLNGTTLDGSKPNANDKVFNEPVRPTSALMTGVYYSKARKKPESASIPLPDGGQIIVNLVPEEAKSSGGGRQLAERPAISVLYNDELYHRRDQSRDYQKFAISSAKVYRRLAITIQPRIASNVSDPQGGVFPTSSRTSLNYIQPEESKATGRDLPWTVWEQIFIDQMPDFVVKAIEASIPDDHADVDQDVVEKVAQPFMDMFKQMTWIPSEGGSTKGTTKDTRPGGAGGGTGGGGGGGRKRKKPKSNSNVGSKGGSEDGRQARTKAAIPECRFDHEAFDDEERSAKPRVGVKYIPGATGRLGQVVIDPRFPLIEDVTDHWIGQTAPPQHEDARKAVQVVYATAMACRVGQLLALAKETGLTEAEIRKAFMSNESLTASLFGLASEYTVIKNRLSGRIHKAA